MHMCSCVQFVFFFELQMFKSESVWEGAHSISGAELRFRGSHTLLHGQVAFVQIIDVYLHLFMYAHEQNIHNTQ